VSGTCNTPAAAALLKAQNREQHPEALHLDLLLHILCLLHFDVRTVMPLSDCLTLVPSTTTPITVT
jgi:hypothetical protein